MSLEPFVQRESADWQRELRRVAHGMRMGLGGQPSNDLPPGNESSADIDPQVLVESAEYFDELQAHADALQGIDPAILAESAGILIPNEIRRSSLSFPPPTRVYFAAGPGLGSDSASEKCTAYDYGTCGIYRVNFVPGLSHSGHGGHLIIDPYEVTEADFAGADEQPNWDIIDARGATQPAISPDGERIAWVLVLYSGDHIVYKAIFVSLTRDPTQRVFVDGGVYRAPEEGRTYFNFQFPNWRSDELLLHTRNPIPESGGESKRSEEQASLYQREVSYSSGAFELGSAEVLRDYDTDGVSTQDPYTDPNGASIAVFGAGVPRVITSDRYRKLDQDFELGTLASPYDESEEEISECHHPAWSSEGRVLCTAIHCTNPAGQ